MLKLQQLASHQIKLAVINSTARSEYLITKELNLLPKENLSLIDKFFKITTQNKKKSIIYKSIKGFLRNSYQNKDNAENILSEAFCLFKEASIKFFNQEREINFEQFAIVHIRENIKTFLNKSRNLNSSDQNELIHSAIKQIKKNSCKTYLTNNEIEQLVKHFGLCSKKGYKKIWRLEALHHKDIPLWKKIENNEGIIEDVSIFENKKINFYDNNNQNEFDDPAFEIERKEETKNFEFKINILNNFKKNLENKNEKIIFEKRIYNKTGDFIKLKELSNILNISMQRISFIEKNMKIKLKNFYSVENKKITGIK